MPSVFDKFCRSCGAIQPLIYCAKCQFKLEGITEYKGWTISVDVKPIPSRSHDFDFVHPDYDGPGDPRCGSAASFRDCMIRIDEIMSEIEEDA
jgi:hypothetical protein